VEYCNKNVPSLQGKFRTPNPVWSMTNGEFMSAGGGAR